MPPWLPPAHCRKLIWSIEVAGMGLHCNGESPVLPVSPFTFCERHRTGWPPPAVQSGLPAGQRPTELRRPCPDAVLICCRERRRLPVQLAATSRWLRHAEAIGGRSPPPRQAAIRCTCRLNSHELRRLGTAAAPNTAAAAPPLLPLSLHLLLALQAPPFAAPWPPQCRSIRPGLILQTRKPFTCGNGGRRWRQWRTPA